MRKAWLNQKMILKIFERKTLNETKMLTRNKEEREKMDTYLGIINLVESVITILAIIEKELQHYGNK